MFSSKLRHFAHASLISQGVKKCQIWSGFSATVALNITRSGFETEQNAGKSRKQICQALMIGPCGISKVGTVRAGHAYSEDHPGV